MEKGALFLLATTDQEGPIKMHRNILLTLLSSFNIINIDKRNYGPDHSHCMPGHSSFSCKEGFLAMFTEVGLNVIIIQSVVS